MVNHVRERNVTCLTHSNKALRDIFHDLFADRMVLVQMLDDQLGLEHQTFEE